MGKQTKTNMVIMNSFLIFSLLLVTIFFSLAPGTDDVLFWKNWATNANSYGVVSGFRANNDMYPPLATLILAISVKAANLLNFDIGGGIRLAVLAFSLLTSLIFWMWTKDFNLSILLHMSLLLGSVAFKSIDIFFAPFLLISFWALKEKKFILFAIAYTLAFLIKWQPIIIAPLIALYLVEINSLSHFKKIKFKRIALQVVLPATLVLLLILLIFGFGEVFLAFRRALTNNYLSGNALNLNWIVTHLLHVFDPNTYGGLIDGLATYIVDPPSIYMLPSRILFYVIYLATLIKFIKVEKRFENLILFSLAGYLAYFTLNTGVHESHLFLAALLAIIMYWLNKQHAGNLIIIMIIYHVNLLLFYGVDGRGLPFSRAINGKLDIALLFAIFNVCFFVYFWIDTIIGKKHPEMNKTKQKTPINHIE